MKTTRVDRWLGGPLLIAAVLLAASCAGGGDTIEVELSADADAVDRVEVKYTVNGVATTETVDVPWIHELSISDSFDIELTVTNPDDRGRVTCLVDLGRGSPRTEGAQAATCTVSGTASGESLTFSSATEVTDRSGPSILDDDGGVSFETAIVDLDGVPSVPELFSRLDVVLRFSGLDEAVSISYDVSATDPLGGRLVVEGSERLDEDDVAADGTLLFNVFQRDGYEPELFGTYRIAVAGSVQSAGGDGVAVPFADEIVFDIAEVADEGAAPVELLDGLVTLDLPSNWVVASERSAATRVPEELFADAVQLSGDDIEDILGLRTGSGEVDFALFRVTRPLLVGDVDDVAAGLLAIYEEAGPLLSAQIEPADVFGVPGRLLTVTTSDLEIDVRVARILDEYFVLQVRAPSREALFAAASGIADSIRIDAHRVERLTHFTRRVARIDDEGGAGLLELTFDIPADWIFPEGATGTRFTNAASTRSVDLFRLDTGDRDLDELVSDVRSENAHLFADVSEARGEIDGYPVAFLTAVRAGERRGVTSIVAGADGRTQFVFFFSDTSAQPDTALIDAMVASIATSGPFGG